MYVARNDAGIRLYVRALAEFDDHPILGTDSGQDPFFAPDGQSVGFFANGKLKKVSLAGGTPADVCDVNAVPLGATWNSDGTIVLGSVKWLRLVAGAGRRRCAAADPAGTEPCCRWRRSMARGAAGWEVGDIYDDTWWSEAAADYGRFASERREKDAD